MSDPLEFSPELRSLLIELAERPERVGALKKHLLCRELLLAEPMVKPSLGWDAAEEYLLRAHREEVASLLLEASQWTLRASGRPILHARDERGRLKGVDRRRWKQRTTHQLRLGSGMPRALGPLELLQRALDPGATGKPTARELALASMRLVPRTEAIMYVASTTSYGGDIIRARRMYERALEGSPSEFLSGLIWQNLAALACKAGRFQDAVECARKGASSASDPQRAAIAWFTAALQAGQAAEVRNAAASLRHFVADDSEELVEYVGYLQVSRKRVEWTPTREAVSVVKHGSLHLPLAGERIVEALV